MLIPISLQKDIVASFWLAGEGHGFPRVQSNPRQKIKLSVQFLTLFSIFFSFWEPAAVSSRQ